MLQRGDSVPHVQVRTMDGAVFAYSSIWQSRHLVLLALPAHGDVEACVSGLVARREEFAVRGTACAITRDVVPGLPAPGVLVADRWGEIVHIVSARDCHDLPAPAELLDWVEYLGHRCPECEGEAR